MLSRASMSESSILSYSSSVLLGYFLVYAHLAPLADPLGKVRISRTFLGISNSISVVSNALQSAGTVGVEPFSHSKMAFKAFSSSSK